MNFYLVLFIGLSIASLLLYGFSFFSTKDKRFVPVIIATSLIVLVGTFLLVNVDIANSFLGLVMLEITPALGWIALFVFAYDSSFLSKKWRYALAVIISSIFTVMLLLFFFVEEIDESFRQLYVIPLIALIFLFSILRIVQRGQNRTWFYLVAVFLYVILLVVFIGAPSVAYFVYATGGFVVIIFLYGLLLRPGKKVGEIFFGKEKRVIPKISVRTQVLMMGTFVIIFLLSLFFLYIAVRELFVSRLELNLNYQNRILAEELQKEIAEDQRILSNILKDAESLDAKSLLVSLKGLNDNVLAVKVSDGREAVETPAGYNFSEVQVRKTNRTPGMQYSFGSDSEFRNPVLILMRQHSDSRVEVHIDIDPVFDLHQFADEHLLATRIGLLSPDQKPITFPVDPPYFENLSRPSDAFSNLCSEAFDQCNGGVCPVLNKRFLVDRSSFESSLMSNSTQAFPDLGICSTAQLRLNETVITPSNEQSIYFIIVGIVFILTSLLASRSFERSITLPIEKLNKNVSAMKQGEEMKSLELRYNDEIGELAKSFNGLVVSLNDARKNVEKKVIERTRELDAEKGKVEVIIQNMNDGLLFISPEGKIQLFNTSAQSITGYTFSEAIGEEHKKIFQIFDEKNMKKEIDPMNMTEESRYDLLKVQLKNKKGEYKAIQYSISAVEYEEIQIGYVVTFQDIEEERQVQLMKQNFASIASHQLKTPMAAVKWLLEMVLEESGQLPDEQLKYLQQAFEANSQMIDLVNELLKVSRLESGKIQVEAVESSIVPIIQNVISAHKANAKGHNAVLKYESFEEELPNIYADPTLTESVLDNFVSNAIEYSKPGVNNEVVIAVEVKKDMMRVEVRDKGIGIKEEDKRRVFTSFFRSEGAENIRAEGTGLGLFIAKMIIENSGGRIGFTSEFDKGSTFFFELPIYKSVDHNLDQKKK